MFKGIIIPDGYHFEYVNDSEAEEFRTKEDASNLVTATIAKTMKDAAGAVVADQRAQPSRTEIERDVAQRLHRAVTLLHAIHGDSDTHRKLRLAVGFGGGAIKGCVSTTPPG